MNVSDLEVGGEYLYSKTDKIIRYVGTFNDGLFDHYIFRGPWLSRLELSRFDVHHFVRPISTYLANA